jgi:hypothetical protein
MTERLDQVSAQQASRIDRPLRKSAAATHGGRGRRTQARARSTLILSGRRLPHHLSYQPDRIPELAVG